MDREVLEKLLEISRRMAENRAMQPLLNYAMQEAMLLLRAERGYLVLINPDGSLDFRVRQDSRGNELANPDTEISYTILNPALEGKSQMITDALGDPMLLGAASVVALQLRSVLCVPLISRGAVIGAIYIENRTDAAIFQKDDLTLLTLFANQAAVLIENAMILDSLEMRVAERTAELENANSQLEVAWLDAVEANRVRTSFLANLTHDMRAPLSVALGASSMIETEMFGAVTEEQREWIERTIQALKHVVNLTDDMFSLTKHEDSLAKRTEGKGLSVVVENVDLNDFLQRLYNIGMALPWAKEVKFRLDIQSDLPTVSLDPVRIRQVLFNLLSNAIKFTAAGEVVMYARYLANEDQVMIGVRDSGAGIPEHLQGQLFQRFQQLDDNLVRRNHNAGLGLAISRELVELHGGQIWVESQPGVGSDFKFVLPR